MFRQMVLGAALLVAGIGQARADVFTQLGTVDGTLGTLGGAMVTNVARLNFQGGVSYNNTFQNATTGTLSVGDRSIAVFAVPLSNFNTGSGGTPNFTGNAALVGVAEAVVGSFAGPGIPNVSFPSGKVFIVPNSGMFSTGDPSTWGNLANAVATYAFGTPDNVLQGDIDATGAAFLASQINTITLNLGAPQNSQGRVLAYESPASNFVNNTTANGLPSGFIPFGPEGLFSVFSETIDNPSAAAFNLNASDLAVLNNIVAFANLGVNGNQFASGLGSNPATDAPGLYSPGASAGGGAVSGDFVSQLAITSSPITGVQQIPPPEIPEPMTMTLWGGLMACGLGFGAIKRRRTKSA